MNNEQIPKHKCGLYIKHNEHKCYYGELSIENMENESFKSEEHMMRCIDTQDMWEMQWYPDTPVGSYKICAPTLEELFEFAKEFEGR